MNEAPVLAYVEPAWYTFRGILVIEGTEIEVFPGCMDLLFVNLGDTQARINGIILLPYIAVGLAGSSFSITANKNEFFTGQLNLVFDDPIGSAPLVQVVQRIKVKSNR
jgi:hypothetical protein